MPASPLPPHRFSLAALDWPRESLLSEWRNAISGTFGVAIRAEDIGAFDADLAVTRTEKFVFSTIAASPLQLVRAPAHAGPAALDCVAITLLSSGDVAGLAGDRELVAKTGDIFFIDLAQSLQLLLSTRQGVTSLRSLWFPRSRLGAALRDENALHGSVFRAGTAAGEVLGSALRAFAAATADNMSQPEFDVLAEGIVDMSTRAASRLLADRLAPSSVAPLASFVAIRRHIDRNLAHSALDADVVAKTFGLSRASLYRLFEPVGGVAKYIRRERLRRAYQEVIAPDLSNQRIGQVAYRMGFKNVSAFNRIFQKAYGVSPSEARQKASMDQSVLLHTGDARNETLASWLAQLGP